MFEYTAENIGNNPSTLVIFLHGYNGSIEDHAYALAWLKQYLSDAVLIVPQAPEICDKNPEKRQWFGMLKYDENNFRFAEKATAEQIFAIYDKTEREISKRAAELNDFIGTMQKKYHIAPQKTFLIGFSQGAMLTLYTSLSAKNVSGGVFVLSGLVAGATGLAKSICANPAVYLFHGENDKKVQYKTLELSQKWLCARNIKTEIFSYPQLTHKMCEDEMVKICEIIKQKTAEK